MLIFNQIKEVPVESVNTYSQTRRIQVGARRAPVRTSAHRASGPSPCVHPSVLDGRTGAWHAPS
jgi:hypothetical protein